MAALRLIFAGCLRAHTPTMEFIIAPLFHAMNIEYIISFTRLLALPRRAHSDATRDHVTMLLRALMLRALCYATDC